MEQFSFKKLLDFSPVGWYKVAGLGIKVIVIIIIIFGIKYGLDRLFPPAPANVNAPEVTVEEGGSMEMTVNQYTEKKRAWWIPGPFVELFGQMDSDHGKDITIGSRFGARWDW